LPFKLKYISPVKQVNAGSGFRIEAGTDTWVPVGMGEAFGTRAARLAYEFMTATCFSGFWMSFIISLTKAGKSMGYREVTRFPSTTTSLSS
jgi:hypothetical protein